MIFGADKDRELGEAQAEIKALRFSERLREKAVEEVILSTSLLPPPSSSSSGFPFTNRSYLNVLDC